MRETPLIAAIDHLLRRIPPETVVIATALVAISAFIGVYLYERQVEEISLSVEFETAAGERIDAISNELARHEQIVRALSAFVKTNPKVSKADYSTYVRQLLTSHGDFQALEWIPRVTHDQRTAFERSASELYPGFQISEISEEGVLVGAAERDIYFLVFYIEPTDGNESALGFDLASEMGRRVALEQARDSGQSSTSDPLKLVQEVNGAAAFLLYVPVYEGVEPPASVVGRRNRLLGFALGVFHINDMVEEAISILKPRGIDIWIDERSQDGELQQIYRHQSRIASQSIRAMASSDARFVKAETIKVAGGEWRIVTAPASGYFEPQLGYAAWVLLVGGVFTTLFIAIYVYSWQRQFRATQESDEHFRYLFENMAQGVVYQNVEGNITANNPAAERILGLERTELNGRHSNDSRWQAIHIDGSEFPFETHPSMVALHSGRVVKDVVMGVYNPIESGHRWILVNSVPEFEPDEKKPCQVITTFDDITDLKHATEEAEAQRDIAQSYLDIAGVMMLALDHDGNVMMINRKGLEIVGYNEDEVVGRNWFDLCISVTEQERLWGEVFTPLLSGQHQMGVITHENWIINSSGERRLIEWSNTVLQRDVEGKAIGTLSSGTDVTERRMGEEGLLLRNRAVEATLNGVLITDAIRPNNRITYVNPAFELITGYRAEEVIGKNPNFLQGMEQEQPELEKIRQAVAEHRTGSALLRNYRKDGSLFWNDLHVAPVQDENGRVTHYVGIINDVSEYKRYENQLEYQANHDDLTGLPNRNLMQDRLSQAIAYAHRYQRMAAVLFIDIDQFKVINDSLGHSVGDHMLKIFGDRLKTFAREGDTVARYGGDEFVMVFADVGSVDDIPPIANRLLVDVAQSIDYKDINLHITVSAGISIFPRDGSNSETLLKNADAAMYRAKELERNNFQFFTEELNTRVMERVTLESELRRAIENDELLLHYQPQVNLVSGKITGFEALLRWENPKHGLIPPNRFIPLAEDTGLIIPIGDWVLQTACAQAVAWREMGLPPVVMSINVSMHQLRSLEFNHTIAAALKRHQLPAEQLEIEVTESALMDDPEGVRKLLEKVRDMGVMIALDDLGTGYSSLSQLKHFPFGRLKIDQSFVAELVHETESAAIVRTIIAMSQGLGLNVIAEGVETESQLSILRRNGCYDIQGYYFSRSVESAQAQEMLQNGNVIDIPNDEGARTPTLLLVDDEPNILRALKRTLRDEGYHILAAESADEAFELLAQNEVDVIVSDQRMPKMNGVELLNIVKELYPDAVRMILSGYTDLDTVTEAVNRGWIYRFLAKPWDDQQLRGHIRDAFSSHMQ